MAEARTARVRFECINSILRVENMEASLRFYVDTLGFRNASWGNDDFTSVSRDGTGIYLCRGGQGQGKAWIWVGVEDVEKLHEEYKARGAAIRLPPTNYPWALEMQIEDPDGMCFVLVRNRSAKPINMKIKRVLRIQGGVMGSLTISRELSYL